MSWECLGCLGNVENSVFLFIPEAEFWVEGARVDWEKICFREILLKQIPKSKDLFFYLAIFCQDIIVVHG